MITPTLILPKCLDFIQKVNWRIIDERRSFYSLNPKLRSFNSVADKRNFANENTNFGNLRGVIDLFSVNWITKWILEFLKCFCWDLKTLAAIVSDCMLQEDDKTPLALIFAKCLVLKKADWQIVLIQFF